MDAGRGGQAATVDCPRSDSMAATEGQAATVDGPGISYVPATDAAYVSTCGDVGADTWVL
jgi:hypothetical protein